jgi:hypothetical protein
VREKNYDAKKLQNFVATNKPLLIHDQSLAYNAITDLITRGNGGLFFLDAPGGTRKTLPRFKLARGHNTWLARSQGATCGEVEGSFGSRPRK